MEIAGRFTQDARMSSIIPTRLAVSCRRSPERTTWLDRLPEVLRILERRWSLTLGVPFDDDEVSCAWVAPVAREDGTNAVLKLGMPHMEGTHELDGLRFWDGDPTVRLLEADDGLNAMLLERCTPGTKLRALRAKRRALVPTARTLPEGMPRKRSPKRAMQARARS